ncbi:DUF11 domain-containing protein [Polymorphospora rubra]|uniref:DUF11 domain-containing protein n=1 Tax=Polymorphospora rubra TaxID=338584 RepID=A0A810MXB2_9ACTN|nr:DUF11 domain-containing protein [Polymorphospora rubra]BCJ65190.1 hypothetical protein Prubr_22110 [Polymorphospora rubra]
MHPRIPRAAAGLAAALVAATLTATPAAAAPEATPSADLNLAVSGERVVRYATVKQFFVRLSNDGPDAAQGVKVTIDAGDIDQNVLIFGLPSGPGCEEDGPTKVTCELGDLASGTTVTDFPALFATTPKRKGSAGSFTVTVNAVTTDPNEANNTQTVNVEAVPGGLDLTAVARDVYADYADNTPVAPGETGDLHWALYNAGRDTVQGVTFEIALPPYVTFADQRPGCKYNAENTVASCRRDARIVGPGEIFMMVRPMKVKVAADAPGPVGLSGGWVVGYANGKAGPDARSLAARSAGEDTVVEAADEKVRRDADPSDNAVQFAVVTGRNPVDLSVTGTPATGAVGDTVEVAFEATNKGPATSSPLFKVQAPAGTTALLPEAGTLPSCVEEDGGLVCGLDGELGVGQTTSFALKFRIDAEQVGADGQITVSNTFASPESAPEDNAAPITITVSGDGPGGPGGGSGGGGGLPVTGVQATLLGGVGLLVLVVGGVLLVLARRRRVVLVTPTEDR